MNKETQEKINQLSMLEQNMQNFASQKQQFQAQLMEAESAEKELENSRDAYKIIGNIMVARDKSRAKDELKEKQTLLKKRIDAFEKQESKLRERAEALQKEVLEEMKKADKKK